MGLVTNGTRFSQTEIPNRKFPNFFVNGKRPEIAKQLHEGLIYRNSPSHNFAVEKVKPLWSLWGPEISYISKRWKCIVGEGEGVWERLPNSILTEEIQRALKIEYTAV